MTNTEKLALALIVLGVVSRLIPHPPNMTAVVGVSLLAAYAIRNGWLAALVPLAIMVLADVVLGWHSAMLFTYAGMALAVVIGRWLLPRLSTFRLVGAALMSSLAFFLVSNFGVWLGGYYGPGIEGLIACYAAAIPFFGNSLAGDLGSTAILFGLYLFARRHAGPQPHPENT